MAKELKIEGIVIRHTIDTSPDFSDLGEYRNNVPGGQFAIDRQEIGDMKRGEYRYFVPAMTGEETGNPDSPMQDYKRAEALNNEEWHYLIISAVAKIRVNGISQEISSGGLSGIPSDSGEDELGSVAEEQMSEVADQLEALGFKRAEIKKALKNPKVVTNYA